MSENPQTKMVDVGGRRLAVTSRGTGAPTVILETGLGAEASEWAAVERDITTARVVHYDRANRGASDPHPGPRTALDMVQDLKRLLQAEGIAPPYVLVGHSWGGLLVRLYAHKHPHEVAGVVLVDAMHQHQFDVFGPLFPPPTPSDHPEFVKVRSFWQGGWRSPDATTEKIDFVSSIRQADEITSLGDIPLHVIIAGTYQNQPLIPQQFRGKLQQLWQDQQMGFLKLSTRASHSFALDSGHFIQRDKPKAASDAINAMLRDLSS